MAFRAVGTFNGKTMHALHVNMELSRLIDPTGQKASATKGGRLEVTVQADENTDLLEKMLNDPFQPFDFELSIKKPNEDVDMKKIECKDAYAVYAEEVFDIDADYPFKFMFTLSAKELTVNGDTLANKWTQ